MPSLLSKAIRPLEYAPQDAPCTTGCNLPAPIYLVDPSALYRKLIGASALSVSASGAPKKIAPLISWPSRPYKIIDPGLEWTDEELRSLPCISNRWPSTAKQKWEERFVELRRDGWPRNKVRDIIGGTAWMVESYLDHLREEGLLEPSRVRLAPVLGMEGKLYYSDPADVRLWKEEAAPAADRM